MELYIPLWLLWSAGLLLLIRLPFTLWVFYLAVMNLKVVRDTTGLHPRTKVLGSIVLIEGYVKDFLVNILLSIVLLEFPRELTVSERLKRHNVPGTNRLSAWRYRVAQWFEPLLDPHDPSGDHI